MKLIPVSLLFAGLLLPSLVVAQPEKDRRPEKGPRQGQRGPVKGLQAADADGDGRITLDEFRSIPRIQKLNDERSSRVFGRLDKDGDKVLSGEELKLMSRPPHEEREAMMRFRELDLDKSGGVSLEEMKVGELFKKLPPEKLETLFARLDTDGDGEVTVRDRPARPPGGPERPEKRMDRPDRPGKPERPEMVDRPGKGGGPERGRDPRRLLREFDTNGDGALSFEEFRKSPAIADLSEDQQEDRFEAIDKNSDKRIDATDLPAAEAPRKKPAPGPADKP